MIYSHIFSVVIVKESFEGVLEMSIGALDKGIVLGVQILIWEVDSLAVHLL